MFYLFCLFFQFQPTGIKSSKGSFEFILARLQRGHQPALVQILTESTSNLTSKGPLNVLLTLKRIETSLVGTMTVSIFSSYRHSYEKIMTKA